MSLKYKLSITITGLLLVVIVVFQLVWVFTQQKKSMETLSQSAQGISSQLINWVTMDAPNAKKQLPELFELIKADKPYLTNIVITHEDTIDMLGTYEHRDELQQLMNVLHSTVGRKEALQIYTEQLNGRAYYISDYLSLQDPQERIFILYDKVIYDARYGEDKRIFYAVFIYLVIFSCAFSYWFVTRTLKPLKDILWKVNEVSSVRFQRPIPITTKDEFGMLAFKINAMSQNLSIYMNKLRHAFDENRRMRLYMESFINHSTDAIYIMDIDGKVIQANRAFEELFGYSSTEAIGNRYCIVPEHLIQEKEEMLQLLQKGESIMPLETYRMTKSGEAIPVSITINPIRDINNQLTGFANICRDMRHRHRMEELIRRSEKLKTVGQLAAGVAHEIRNPLTTLRGFLQLQMYSKKLNVDHINVMLSELERINLIVGEFLILSKPQAVKFKRRDIRDILSEVSVLMNSEALMHNVMIKENYTKDNCDISCEDNQLKQVFINLLKNAIEAMPDGGHIHVSVQRLAQHVSIEVIDEGMGMDEEILGRIGDPFFTAKENGTGLGIMVSQKIVQSHHGIMELSSEVNVGTTVKILLPLQENGQYAEASNM